MSLNKKPVQGRQPNPSRPTGLHQVKYCGYPCLVNLQKLYITVYKKPRVETQGVPKLTAYEKQIYIDKIITMPSPPFPPTPLPPYEPTFTHNTRKDTGRKFLWKLDFYKVGSQCCRGNPGGVKPVNAKGINIQYWYQV
jgi:hypothetical protein